MPIYQQPKKEESPEKGQNINGHNKKARMCSIIYYYDII